MILGISSFTYGWTIGVEGSMPQTPWSETDLIEQTRRFGLSGLQIGDNLPVHKFSEERQARLSHDCQKHSIRLELGARSLTPQNLSYYIDLAGRLNARLLRFVIDGDDFRPETNTVIAILKDHDRELKERNLLLGIENHDRFKSKELATIMEACGSDHIGICLDCVNSMGAGEGLEHVAETLAPYTINLHIKDFTVTRLSHKMGFTITGAPTGTGMTNLPWLLDKLSRYKRCESAVLEQWVIPEKTIEETVEKEKRWAQESIQYIRKLGLLDISPEHLNFKQ